MEARAASFTALQLTDWQTFLGLILGILVALLLKKWSRKGSEDKFLHATLNKNADRITKEIELVNKCTNWEEVSSWKCQTCRFENKAPLSRCLLCLDPRLDLWECGQNLPMDGPQWDSLLTFFAPYSLLGKKEEQANYISNAGLVFSDCKTDGDIFRRATSAWMKKQENGEAEMKCSTQDSPSGIMTRVAQYMFPRGGENIQSYPPHFYERYLADKELVSTLRVIKDRVEARRATYSAIRTRLGTVGTQKTLMKERDQARQDLTLSVQLFWQRNTSSRPLLEVLSRIEDHLLPGKALLRQLKPFLPDETKGNNGENLAKVLGKWRDSEGMEKHFEADKVYSALLEVCTDYEITIGQVKPLLEYTTNVIKKVLRTLKIDLKGFDLSGLSSITNELDRIESSIQSLQVQEEDNEETILTLKRLRARKCAWKRLAIERQRAFKFATKYRPELVAQHDCDPAWENALGLKQTGGDVTAIAAGICWNGASFEDFTRMISQPSLLTGEKSRSRWFVKDMDGVGWDISRLETETMESVHILFAHAATASSLNHPNLVPIRGVFMEGAYVYLAVDFFESQTLKSWLTKAKRSPPSREDCKSILKQILEGVEFLHEHGMVHSDLKPNVISVVSTESGMKVKLSGMIRINGWRIGQSAIAEGETRYFAPEIKTGENQAFTSQTDMYSIGVLMQEIFRHENGSEVDEEFRTFKHQLLDSFLSSDPGQRMSISEALGNPFFHSSSGPDRNNNRVVSPSVQCPVCLDEVPEHLGVRCAKRHFICNSDLARHLETLSHAQLAKSEKIGASCFLPECREIYPAHELARHVSVVTFDQYLDKLSEFREVQVMCRLEEEFQQRRQELVQQLTSESLAGLAKEHADHIVNNILTLKCPNGHAFLDFTGCFALECSVCNIHFCGYCFADCGTDAHGHVRQCPYNLVGGSLFAPIEYFHRTQRERRKLLLNEFARDNLSQNDVLKQRVFEVISPLLKDIGLEDYSFP